MSYVPIKRPKFSFLDKIYVVELVKGLIITFKHLALSLMGKSRSKKDFNGKGVGACMPFPDQRWDAHLPEYYRGAPTLVRGEDGRERCVSCQLCEFICPARAITVTPGPVAEGSGLEKQEKAPAEFEIDMLRCIYCGMCQEVCPEQAIFLSKEYLITLTDRKDAIRNKAQLYKLGGTRKGLVNKWNQYK
ncbi:MAG: 4Fe-4S binding protein [Akkermansia sp.]|nr:4Fe-4S binding protein [Akkermansia sp.]